jgi:ABC-type lipoprotein release transport system permease subunit
MTIDLKMSWRNIWRNPRRTVLTVCAIAFASAILVFMLSFQFGSYDAMINTAVKIHTAHLQIQAKGYKEQKDMRLVIANPGKVAEVLEKTTEIEAYSFRGNAFSLVSSKERAYGIMVTGIDPGLEPKVTRIKKSIRKGGYLSKDDTEKALVGELLANNLQVKPGDELTLLGQGRDGSIAATVVTVKGIFQSGLDEFDRNTIQIPLRLFQDVFAMNGSVHEIAAIGKSLSDIEKIKKTVAKGINRIDARNSMIALDWEELMPGLSQVISMDLVSGLIMYVILVLVVAFSILNTFLMAIFERTREFGMMTAIGTTPGRLTRLLLIESSFMTLVGVVAGIILGCLVTWYFQIHGINIAGASEILQYYGISGSLYPKLSLLSATLGPAIVLVITFFAALYPALKVRRLKPVEAMTYV